MEKLSHLCLDFVIEPKSPTDRVRPPREKMREWLANGAQLAWLIDPATGTVEIDRPGREVEVLAQPDSAGGEGPDAGFILRMAPIWDPLRG